MQILNSLLGGCHDLRSHCKALARRGACHSNPYALLRACPIACGIRCSKYFII